MHDIEAACQRFAAHHREIGALHLRDLFAQDPQRGERMHLEAAGIYLDYAKNRLTDRTIALLLDLAQSSGLAERRDAMFRGEPVNASEKRAALHTALRAPVGTRVVIDGLDVVSQVHAMLDRMADFAHRVRTGQWRGYTGKPIRNVVNIGIGGSDLGPAMGTKRCAIFATAGCTWPSSRNSTRQTCSRPRAAPAPTKRCSSSAPRAFAPSTP